MTGDDKRHDAGARGRERLAPPLQIPKNRSTGNLSAAADNPEGARTRFSFDSGAAAAEFDAISRLARRTQRRDGRCLLRSGEPVTALSRGRPGLVLLCGRC